MENNSVENETKTERDFWIKYWEKYTPEVIKDVLFEDIFKKFPSKKLSYVEVGGFPGTFCVYFSKEKGYDVTLLDYFILPETVRTLEEANGMTPNTIKLIETDFFNMPPSMPTFDVVQSAGFIEHFTNTEDVIKRHVDLLKDNGILFISLPNLRGINGWVQKNFDPENLAIHHLPSMDLDFLKSIALKFGLKNISVEYYGMPMCWVEHTSKASKTEKLFIKYLNKGMNLLPFKGKSWSPFIYLKAEK